MTSCLSLPPGLALLDAALDLVKDNLGAATERLGEALALGLVGRRAGISSTTCSACFVSPRRADYGQRLIGWFELSGFDIKYAPVHAALIAYVRGERFWRYVNQEVRRPAQGFYDKLSSLGGTPAGSGPASRSEGGSEKRRPDDRFRGAEQMCKLRTCLLAFPGIEFVLSMNSEKLN